MHYAKTPASAPLASLVKCYYVWEHQISDHRGLTVQSPPSGYEALVFNYGAPYQIETSSNIAYTPRAFYSGQNTANYQLILSSTVGMFGVVFFPGVFSSLFRVSVKGTANQRIPLDEILGTEGKVLTEKIFDACTTVARIQIIERFLLQKLWLLPLHITPADRAAQLITHRNGMVSIQELTTEVGSSGRALDRNFSQKVGISPKLYARIRRFAHVSYLLMYQKADWQDVAYHAGYYDHSHFIKDFKLFNHKNPTTYLQQHKELVKYLER